MRGATRSWYENVYLNSAHWKQLARATKIRYEGRCALCGNDQLPIEVHHNGRQAYARLYCEREIDVLPLCEECHTRHHRQFDIQLDAFTSPTYRHPSRQRDGQQQLPFITLVPIEIERLKARLAALEARLKGA